MVVRKYIKGVLTLLILSTMIFGSGIKQIQSNKSSDTFQKVDTDVCNLINAKPSKQDICNSNQKHLDLGDQSSSPNVFNAPSLEKTLKISSVVYEDHGHISIIGNAAFNSQATTESWPGDGTESSPYIIDGLSISSTGIYDTLIEIRDTDVYFRISNCLLVDGANGIGFSDVENGQISYNIISNTVGGSNGRNGIQFMGQSDNNIISDNSLNNHEFAIHLEEPADNTLIFNNSVYDSINGLIIKGNNNQIENNSVYNNGASVSLFDANDGNISSNTIYNNGDGIYISSSEDCIISRNSIYNNTWNGIFVQESTKIDISINSIFNCTMGIFMENSSNNLMINNTFSDINQGQGIGILNSIDNVISGNSIYNANDTGIRLDFSNNNVVSGNDIYNSIMFGINLYECDRNTILDNIVFNSVFGVWVEESNDNQIISNRISDNENHGIIIVSNSRSNLISNNVVFDNNILGIEITNSNYNTVTNNTISNNEVGLWSGDSEHNSIICNTADNNEYSGINLCICTDCIVRSNTIFDNGGDGIMLEHSSNNDLSSNTLKNNGGFGIALVENFPGISNQSYDNIIQWNNFIDNNQGAGAPRQASDQDGSNNVFSNNYWNDLTSPDDNGDGIVDDFYIVVPINRDNSPLVIAHEFTGLLNITKPIGDVTLKGSVDIEWESANDSIGHTVTYAVYYSSDGGKSWRLLASGLTGDEFQWDTTTLTGDATYKIKVVATCSEGLMTEDISDVTFTEVEKVNILNILTLTTTEIELLIAIIFIVLLSLLTFLIIVWIIEVPIKKRRQKRRREEIRRIWRY